MIDFCTAEAKLYPCSLKDHKRNADLLDQVLEYLCEIQSNGLPINGTLLNTPSHIYDLDQFDGATFEIRLNQAIAYLNPGGIMDLRNQGDETITSTIFWTKQVQVLWTSSVYTYTGAAGTDMHVFQANDITFRGSGRSPKASDRGNVTVFRMASGRYHIFGRGVHQPKLLAFDCDGIKSSDNLQYPNLNGSGGIYFEKADPGNVGGGNNVTGVAIVDVYVESTYAHGIYIDTPILSILQNVRTSNIRGHGIYQNGGTSTFYISCFAASGYQAGLCIQSAAYGSVIGCAAETSGAGYWFRSVQGLSLFSSGGESNKNVGSNITPTRLETTMADTTPIIINDISNDFTADFRGTTFLVTGGQGISLFSPYSTNINQEYGFGQSNQSRHLKIKGNTRGLTITNPRLAINSVATVFNRFDWEFDEYGGDSPSDVIVYYDPSDGTITPVIDSYFTSNNNALESTFIRTDTDDIQFIAGRDIFIPDINDNYVSLRIGSGANTLAPANVMNERMPGPFVDDAAAGVGGVPSGRQWFDINQNVKIKI